MAVVESVDIWVGWDWPYQDGPDSLSFDIFDQLEQPRPLMFQISCQSSLLDGCDEPEILPRENLNFAPQALTSHRPTLTEVGSCQLRCLRVP
jgi:hypothetical protein